LVQHKLSILRDRETPTKIFKELVDEIAMLMAYEATSDLALEESGGRNAARAYLSRGA
jgi:uracil phosphoribosyltransferase